MRPCFLLEPLEPRLTLSAGFIAADGIPGGAAALNLAGHPVYDAHFVLQPDGKVVVSAYDFQQDNDCGGRAFFVRFNPDGSRDPTFGENGITNFSCFWDDFNDLV